MSTTTAGIRLRDVVKIWSSADRRFELSVPELDIEPGQVSVLSGPNGTGKTTLLEMLGLASRPTAGRIAVALPGRDSVDIGALWAGGERAALAALRAACFGYVLQTVHLFPFLTIRRNAELAQKLAGRPDSAYLDALLRRLGVAAHADMLPTRLSPGLRQRAAVARALAHRPIFVIADEPTAALDPDGGRAVIALLLELACEEGAGVILCTHAHRDLPLGSATRHLRTVPQPATDATTVRSVLTAA